MVFRPPVRRTPGDAAGGGAGAGDARDRALHKPGACDVDVDAAHQGFLRGLRAAGGTVVTGARVTGLARRGGRWHAGTPAGDFSAPLVVNAAGAWADDVARLAGVPPAGLVAYRRTAALARVPDDRDVTGWPMVTDVADTCTIEPDPATVGGGPEAYWHSYTYDAVGNRTTETQHAVAGTATDQDVTRTYT